MSTPSSANTFFHCTALSLGIVAFEDSADMGVDNMGDKHGAKRTVLEEKPRLSCVARLLLLSVGLLYDEVECNNRDDSSYLA